MLAKAAAIAQIISVPVFALILATLWATQKSYERAECYRERPVRECPQPGPFESFVRWING